MPSHYVKSVGPDSISVSNVILFSIAEVLILSNLGSEQIDQPQRFLVRMYAYTDTHIYIYTHLCSQIYKMCKISQKCVVSFNKDLMSLLS